MFLVFALIATLPLMALSYLALGEARSALEQEVGDAHRDAAQAAAGFVDVYVENGRVLLDTESRSPYLLDNLRRNDSSGMQRAVADLQARSVYQDQAVFHSVLLLDEDGRVLAAYPDGAATRGADLSESPIFIATKQTGELRTLSVTQGASPAIPMGAPVFFDARLEGVIVASLGLEALGTRLRAFAPDPGQEMFLVDRAGHLVAHTNASATDADLEWGALAPAVAARDGESGFMEFVMPASEGTWLAAYAPIPRLGWGVVSGLPTNVAYEGLSRLTAVLIVLSGILIGTILLASVVVARRIVQPVEELTEAAASLAAGRLNTRIAPRGDDEIGELGRAFNEMANRIGESLDGIRRSEARYRSLVESANDLIFTIQPDATFSFASSHALPLLGRAPHTLVGQPSHAFVHEGDRLAFVQNVRHVLDEGEPVLWVPCRLLTSDGGSRTVLINFSPIFDQGDRPARVLCVAHDVTQERRQELIRDKAFTMARLVSEQAALEPLLNRGLALLLAVVSVPRGVAYVGEGGALEEVASANLDGLSRQERVELAALAQRAVLDKSVARARIHDDRTAIAIPLVEQGEALGAVVLQGDDQDLSGENLDVLGALSSQLAVGVRRTLQERRLHTYAAELETRVRERTAELTEKSREMESFLYSVSHDLKAPLISIQGYAEGLQEDYGGKLDDDASTYLERIRKNASHMESLILDILELSRIGRVREDVTHVDMDALMGEVAGRDAPRFAALGGSLDVAADLPRVRGERKRLLQMMSNLVDNALKYRHPDRAPRVRVWGERHGAEAVLHIQDNGRGIPETALPRLFEIFQRVPAPGFEDPGGTGIGLAIVKRIVDTHKGQIDVESKEGEGTTFHVRLPY